MTLFVYMLSEVQFSLLLLQQCLCCIYMSQFCWFKKAYISGLVGDSDDVKYCAA